ncbi:MAG: hypothetical protein AAF604_02005 [Acidobacteriota bacterium]
MLHPPTADLEGLLAEITRAEVEVIVIGGVAAVIHGAPITTIDLDVVYRRTSQSLDRLETLLKQLDARVRDPAGRSLRPTRGHLEADGALLLTTRLGPFDPLATLPDGRDFEALLPDSEVVATQDLSVRVLTLDALIDIKRSTGRAKDRLMLGPLLALKEK